MQIKAKTKNYIALIAVFFALIHFLPSVLFKRGYGIYHVSLGTSTDTHGVPFQNFLIYGVNGRRGK